MAKPYLALPEEQTVPPREQPQFLQSAERLQKKGYSMAEANLRLGFNLHKRERRGSRAGQKHVDNVEICRLPELS
jgi:hypothetical protein